jgi:hypothetical protein
MVLHISLGDFTPASTASKARPPFARVFHASLLAAMPKSQVDITIGKFLPGVIKNRLCRCCILILLLKKHLQLLI